MGHPPPHNPQARPFPIHDVLAHPPGEKGQGCLAIWEWLTNQVGFPQSLGGWRRPCWWLWGLVLAAQSTKERPCLQPLATRGQQITTVTFQRVPMRSLVFRICQKMHLMEQISEAGQSLKVPPFFSHNHLKTELPWLPRALEKAHWQRSLWLPFTPHTLIVLSLRRPTS